MTNPMTINEVLKMLTKVKNVYVYSPCIGDQDKVHDIVSFKASKTDVKNQLMNFLDSNSMMYIDCRISENPNTGQKDLYIG